MSRAGWSLGIARASKLWKSVSICGPSATSKPSSAKMATACSRIWVRRCSRPAGTARPGRRHVDRAREIGARGRLAQLGQAARDLALDGLLDPVEGGADLAARLGRELAHLLHELGQAALLAEVAGLERAHVLLVVERRQLARELGAEGVELADQFGGGHRNARRPERPRVRGQPAQAPAAVVTMAWKAGGSLMAISASILRLSSISLFLSAPISLE